MPTARLLALPLVLWVALSLFVFSARVTAVDFWVSATGTNGNGSSVSPFTNVTEAFETAVQAMEIGDVVLHFNPGYYILENGLSSSSSNYYFDRTFTVAGVNPTGISPPPVTLECAVREWAAFYVYKIDFGRVTFQDLVVLNCGGAFAVTADGVTLDNVQVRGSMNIAVELTSSDNSITNCVFEDNDLTAVHVQNSGGDLLIQGCRFINNGAYDEYPDGLWAYNGYVLSIVDCVFEGNGVTDANFRYVWFNESIVRNSPGVGFSAYDSTEVYVSRSKIVFNVGGVWADQGSIDRAYNNKEVERGKGPIAGQIYFTNDSILWQNVQQGGQDVFCANGGNVYLYPANTDLCAGCPTGTNFDRCFVCGGDDSCLGCDGVPYSGVSNCTPAALPFVSSSGPVGYNGQAGTLVTIDPLQMSAVLTPANASGDPIDPRYELAVYLVSITEKRPNGSVYQQYDFTTWPFFLTSTGLVQIQGHEATQTIYDYYFSTEPTHILVSWVYFADQANLTDHGVPFTLAPQNLKITLEIDDWAWENGNLTANALEVVVRTENTETISGAVDVVQPLQGNFSLIQRFVDTQHTQATFSFLNFAYFERPEGEQLEIIELAEVPNLGDSRNTYFMVTFPGFFSSVHYDPDFSVTLTGREDSGDGDDNLGLIIGLSVGLPLAGFIVLAVIIGGTVVLWIQRKRLVRSMTAGHSGGSDDLM